MAENQEPNRGDVRLDWTFPEFEHHDRSRGWYITAFVIVVGSIVISAFGRNYTFIALIVLITIVLLARLRRTPLPVRFAIRDEGLEIGQRFYPWSDLQEFWILYKPPTVKKLYFHFKSSIRPPIDIDLMDQNPIRVRQILSEYLLEDTKREEEPGGDQVTRFLKI